MGFDWGSAIGGLAGMFGGGKSSKTARHSLHRMQRFIKAQKSVYDNTLRDKIYNEIMSRSGQEGQDLIKERYGRIYGEAKDKLRADAARRGMYRSGSTMENLQKLGSEEAYRTAEAQEQAYRRNLADMMGFLNQERAHQIAVGGLGQSAANSAANIAAMYNNARQQDINQAAGVISEISRWFRRRKRSPQDNTQGLPGTTVGF